MIKKFLTILLFIATTTTMLAIPAKRGTYKMITLSDGTTVQAELRGDEHVHYWQAEDGRTFIKDSNSDHYVLTDVKAMVADYENRRADLERKAGPHRAAGTQPTEPLIGEMKGIIILVEFADKKFQASHTPTLYNNVANTEGFSNTMGFKGSVRDYFLAQSDGLLDYSFDVVGPVTLTQNYSFYGKNNNYGSDTNLKYFVEEALNAVPEDVDFSKYDNDGDGWVDQVFFLYAGKGEADSSDANTIWPHMYYAYRALGIEFERNDVGVDVYACSNEVSGYGRASGIGAICHEFSHCLGLPDMYDTGNVGNYANNEWDVMCSGNYNDNSFTPCGYTAYERAYCGWRPLIELTEDVELENLPSISEGGSAYVVYNEANRNEYYIFEPRNNSGWDSSLKNTGMLIYHVDYDRNAWRNNTVNNSQGHQRCAIVAADNSYNSRSSTDIKNDIYPYVSTGWTGTITNNSFNGETTPAAAWFNKNILGTNDTYFSVYDITRNADHTVSFKFDKLDLPEYNPEAPEGAVFYESFGRCHGVGGNDGVFNKMNNVSFFLPDHEGWDATDANGANECAIIGKVSTANADMWVASPIIRLEEGKVYKLCFKSAPYSIYTNNLEVSLFAGVSEEPTITTFETTRNVWTDYELLFTASGEDQFYFYRNHAFYLDEITIFEATEEEAGIDVITTDNNSHRAYNLSGQQVNTDNYQGIIIKGGKKVILN